jgi:hypothetical protein
MGLNGLNSGNRSEIPRPSPEEVLVAALDAQQRLVWVELSVRNDELESLQETTDGRFVLRLADMSLSAFRACCFLARPMKTREISGFLVRSTLNQLQDSCK